MWVDVDLVGAAATACGRPRGYPPALSRRRRQSPPLSRHTASNGEGCSKQPPRRPRWLAGTPDLGSSVGTSLLKTKKKKRENVEDGGRRHGSPDHNTTNRSQLVAARRWNERVCPIASRAVRRVCSPARGRGKTRRGRREGTGTGPTAHRDQPEHAAAPRRGAPVAGSSRPTPRRSAGNGEPPGKKKKKKPTRRRNDTTAGAQQRRSIQGGCPAHKTKRIEKLQETHNGRHGPRPRKEAHRHAQHKNAQAAHRSRGRLPTQADTPRGAARDT